jgi:hypothetical protein
MKLAFIAHRANYLKHYGPIIDAALGRGWQVECWLRQTGGVGKQHLNITPQMFRDIWGDRVSVQQFEEKEQVINMVSARKPDAIISLHPRSWYLKPGNEMPVFITLQHSVDTFVEATPEELGSSDYVCLFSPYWLEYAAKYYQMSDVAKAEEVEAALAGKVAYTGFAQMDAFANIDPIEVRRRWGIDADQPVLLLLPVDLAGWPGAWPPFFAATSALKQWRALLRGGREEGLGFVRKYWQWALRGLNDRTLTKAIGKFCESNEAFLLVKGREKDPLRQMLLEKADKSFYDEAHYPATIFEAIAIASLCIVFYSTAAQEAAYAGVPSVCVDRPNKDLVKHRLWRRKETDGPYNYPGVVDWTTIPQMIKEFPRMSFSDFKMDAQARQDYLLKYNGPADHKASQRILDLVGGEK